MLQKLELKVILICSVLNPSGVRFGSAEIYNIVEEFKEVKY